MLERLKDHFIICGYGRIGSIVARAVPRQGVPFVVIERDPDRVHAAIEDGALGGGSRREPRGRAASASASRARAGLIAAVGTDAENVYAVLSARVLRPDLFIVGRAETEDATQKLKRAGADRVMSPYQIGGVQIAQTALRPAVVDFVELATSSDNLDLTMEEITIDAGVAAGRAVDPRGEPAAALRRHRRRHPARRTGGWSSIPSRIPSIRAGDKLVVLGRPESLTQPRGGGRTA